MVCSWSGRLSDPARIEIFNWCRICPPSKGLASAGSFFFALLQYSHAQAFAAPFVSSMQNYTTSDAKSFTGLCRSFSGYLPHFAPVIRLRILLCCTACKALEDIQASAAPPPIPDTNATPGAVQVSTAAYYNKVYKGSANHASPAGSAPAVCGSLASAAPGAPAEGSASPPIQGQPGGLLPGIDGQRADSTAGGRNH